MEGYLSKGLICSLGYKRINNSSVKGLLWRLFWFMDGKFLNKSLEEEKQRLAQILRVGIYCHHAATFVYDMLWIRIS